MVGIVVVSHSRALAQAAVDLASEMVQGKGVRIEIAAGLDDGSIGTDAVAVSEAIIAADDPDAGDGVVVLCDLGSAVLSAQTAMEFLDPGVAARAVLSPAPLVEGLVVAAVAAAAGVGRTDVARQAEQALQAKADQLADDAVEDVAAENHSAPDVGSSDDPVGESVTGEFTLTSTHGLHARPASLLVQALGGLDVTVELRNETRGKGPVPAINMGQLILLRAERGHRVSVRASGPDRQVALDRVLALAEADFAG